MIKYQIQMSISEERRDFSSIPNVFLLGGGRGLAASMVKYRFNKTGKWVYGCSLCTSVFKYLKYFTI